jgi:molybdopterin-binding protein
MTVSKWERGVLEPTPHALAILRALDAAAGRRAAPREARDLAGYLNQAFIEVSEIEDMKISASNQLSGKVVELEEGPVSSRVVIEVAPRVRVTSLITTASVRRLGLRVGKPAIAVIKATEVIVAVR